MFASLNSAMVAFGIGLAVASAQAEQPSLYTLPEGEDVVGDIQIVTTKYEDTLVDISTRHGLGYRAIRSANPDVDGWLPGDGSQVVLPTRHILPNTLRAGIVINVAEMRLYYYPATAGQQVEVYAISVGRGDWRTPLLTTKVTSRVRNPVWYPPATIRKEHEARGEPLPRQVPAGPNNPLGKHLLVLDTPSYFIHGTNKKYGIGMQVTHGCIRMYPNDIAHLVKEVPNGTPVRIVNQAIKFGFYQGELFAEVHPPLDGATHTRSEMITLLINYLADNESAGARMTIDWDTVDQVYEQARGLPTPIGTRQRLELTQQDN